MMRGKMNTVYSKFIILVIVLLVAAFLPSSTVFAKNLSPSDEAESSKPVLVEKVVKIIDKGKDFLEIRHQGKFKVDSSTVIYSPDKMRISLIYLDIPCWAKVRYYEGGGELVLKEVHIIKAQPE